MEGGKGDEPDWGEIFTTLLCHTSIGNCETIGEHTIPQINAILERLPKHLSIKVGVPFGGGATLDEKPLNQPGETPKLSQVIAFCNAFGK